MTGRSTGPVCARMHYAPKVIRTLRIIPAAAEERPPRKLSDPKLVKRPLQRKVSQVEPVSKSYNDVMLIRIHLFDVIYFLFFLSSNYHTLSMNYISFMR